jgi:hypothetical protein
MMRSKVLLAAMIFQIAACGGGADTPSVVPTNTHGLVPTTAPAPTSAPETTTTTVAPTTTTEVPIEVLSLPGERSCPGWEPLALAVGWPSEEIPKLSYVIWRESRCQPLAHNSTDPVSGSRGLTQVNGYWCRPNQWTEQGWLQDRGVIETCDDLYLPEQNLRSALLIWLYGVQRHGRGWGPWAV